MASMLKQNNATLRTLNANGPAVRLEVARELAEAVGTHKTLATMIWPTLYEKEKKECAAALQKNGALTNCSAYFQTLCARNLLMHARAKQAAMMLLMIRWRRDQETILHVLPKDVVKIIAGKILETKTQVSVWGAKIGVVKAE